MHSKQRVHPSSTTIPNIAYLPPFFNFFPSSLPLPHPAFFAAFGA